MTRQGFSLVEVMAAMVILALIMASVTEGIGSSHAMAKSTESESRVLHVIEGIVEEIQTVPFAQVGGFDQVTYEVLGVEQADGGPPISLTVEAVPAGATGQNVLYWDVIIVAEWLDLSATRNLTFQYLHVNRGG